MTILYAALLIQLLAKALGKAGADGPSTWAPAPTWEIGMKSLASGIGLSPGRTAVAIQTESADGRRSFSLADFAFYIHA